MLELRTGHLQDQAEQALVCGVETPAGTAITALGKTCCSNKVTASASVVRRSNRTQTMQHFRLCQAVDHISQVRTALARQADDAPGLVMHLGCVSIQDKVGSSCLRLSVKGRCRLRQSGCMQSDTFSKCSELTGVIRKAHSLCLAVVRPGCYLLLDVRHLPTDACSGLRQTA